MQKKFYKVMENLGFTKVLSHSDVLYKVFEITGKLSNSQVQNDICQNLNGMDRNTIIKKLKYNKNMLSIIH